MSNDERQIVQLLLAMVKPVFAAAVPEGTIEALLARQLGVDVSELLNPLDELTSIHQRSRNLVVPSGPKTTSVDGRLFSIFERISVPKRRSLEPDNRSEGVNFRYRPEGLDIGVDTSAVELANLLFPDDAAHAPPTALATLENAFRSEAEHLPTTDFQSTFHALYFLLQKYTCLIPSETCSHVSFFDELRTTTAVAVCQLNGELSQPFLFVAGELSGVHDFVYKIASPDSKVQTSAQLRGRCFYLTLFLETVADYLLKQNGWGEPHILWCDGGNFLMLVPNTPEARHTVDETATHSNRFLLEKFQGQLHLNLVCHPADSAQLGDMRSLLNDLNHLLAQSDAQWYQSLLREETPDFPLGEGLCAVCERDVYDAENLCCAECVKQGQIGTELAKLKSLIRLDISEHSADELIQFAPEFGIGWCFNTLPASVSAAEIERMTIYTINTTHDFLRPLVAPANIPITHGFRFLANWTQWTSNHTAANYDEPFGVLKVDINNLGAIFQLGVASLSELAALSRSVNLFFSVYLDAVCRDKNFTIIDVSGNDLCFAGAWVELIELAVQLDADFARYTCGNPDFHISAGLFVARDGIPIRRGILSAAERLAQAKLTQNRATFALFGDVIDFRVFSDKLLPILRHLRREVRAGRISHRFSDSLRRIYHDGLVDEMEWRWQYYRLLNRELKDHPELHQLLIDEANIGLIMKHTPIVVSYVAMGE